MRTAIDKIGRGKERDVNVRFMAMARRCLFEPEFCNPASGWEKGQVEKNVQDARHRFFHSTIGIMLDLYSHAMPGMQANAAEQVDATIRTAIKPARK